MHAICHIRSELHRQTVLLFQPSDGSFKKMSEPSGKQGDDQKSAVATTAALAREMLSLQERRAALYNDLRRAHREYLDSKAGPAAGGQYDFAGYRPKVSAATQGFAAAAARFSEVAGRLRESGWVHPLAQIASREAKGEVGQRASDAVAGNMSFTAWPARSRPWRSRS